MLDWMENLDQWVLKKTKQNPKLLYKKTLTRALCQLVGISAPEKEWTQWEAESEFSGILKVEISKFSFLPSQRLT